MHISTFVSFWFLLQAINEDLSNVHAPLELVDGFVECIAVVIPWSALVSDSTKLEVTGLELTLRPVAREDLGTMDSEYFNPFLHEYSC